MSSRTLHLCRALHREASYLPDPASRAFAHRQITNRFHRNRGEPIVKSRTRLDEEYDSILAGADRTDSTTAKRPKEIRRQLWDAEMETKRTTALIAEGRRQLQILKTANSGASAMLAKVLEQTYGRRGKRRHELLRELAPPVQSPTNNSDLRQLSVALDAEFTSSKNETTNNEGTKGNGTKGALEKLPLFSDKFVALLKSQMQQKQDHFPKALPRSSAPSIPDKDSWGRMLPVRRIKNLTKEWYANTLDRLMPPLPEAEWTHLGELAAGQAYWAGPPKKRARGTTSGGTEPQEYEPVGWSWPETDVQRARIEHLRARNAHHLTPRYMRHMWARVFAQCPVMKWDAERAKWKVKWGKVDNGIVLSLDQPDLGFSPFEGVDEKGKVLEEDQSAP